MKLRSLLSASPASWAALNTPQLVPCASLQQHDIHLYLKREDRLHSALSGNKLYKLHGHLQRAMQLGVKLLVSFGGYYSNHLHALASAGAALGVQTLGVVRGHRPSALTPTLTDCRRCGMTLIFVSRKEYARKIESDWVERLLADYTDSRGAYVIPEGGQGLIGARGCGAIINVARDQIELRGALICVPCGTGTTLAGLIGDARTGERLLGFSALRLGTRLAEYKAGIERMLEGRPVTAEWDVCDQFHCGGFAKITPPYQRFLHQFEAETQVPLDPVYTGKMMFGIIELARQGYWQRGQRILAIHTGGLQGKRSPLANKVNFSQ